MGQIYRTKYIKVPVGGHVRPLDAMVSQAHHGETIEFETAEEVSAFVTLKLQEGLRYLAKEDHQDGTFTLYFAIEQPRDSIFG